MNYFKKYYKKNRNNGKRLRFPLLVAKQKTLAFFVFRNKILECKKLLYIELKKTKTKKPKNIVHCVKFSPSIIVSFD